MTGAMVAAAAVSAAGAYAASSNASSGSKGGGTMPSSMWQNMPDWAQQKFQPVLQGMPNQTNVMFGGQSYPSVYGPLMRAGQKLFSPQGQISQDYQPSGISSGLAAAAPYAWMAANKWNNNGGLYNYLNTNYGSPSGMYNITQGASGYVPGWY